MHDALRRCIDELTSGARRLQREDVRALLDAGVTREEMLQAFVHAADDPRFSRRMHRALAILRDFDRHSEPV